MSTYSPPARHPFLPPILEARLLTKDDSRSDEFTVAVDLDTQERLMEVLDEAMRQLLEDLVSRHEADAHFRDSDRHAASIALDWLYCSIASYLDERDTEGK